MLYWIRMLILVSWYATLGQVFGIKRCIRFLPEAPHRNTILWKIMLLNGIWPKTHNSWKKADFIIIYEDFTYHCTDWEKYVRLRQRPSPLPRLLNGACCDISKRTVDKAFTKVFGYSVEVDPTEYAGEMVVKSDANASHDGRISLGPLQPSDVNADFVYNILIDNSNGNGDIVDYRVPIILEEIPFIYAKVRKISNRFKSKNKLTNILNRHELLTEPHKSRIISFAKEINLDIGELDILYCKKQKRYYIVDANNTPGGPPNGLNFLDYFKSCFSLAACLKSQLKNIKE